MSLVGNLADLGLGDIFQIVSLSRRSGTLQLTTPVESGEIVFRSGKVVAAYRSNSRASVGEGLLEAGVIAPTTYQEMLSAQKAGKRALDLFAGFRVDKDALQGALDGILKQVVYAMFEWAEGTFSFVLEEAPDIWRGFTLEGSRAVSDNGLNPQYLAIEGARLRDERAKEDTLSTFLMKAQPPAQPRGPAGLNVQEIAAKLRSAADLDAHPGASSSGPGSDKVIPFPAERVRGRPAAAEAVAPPKDPELDFDFDKTPAPRQQAALVETSPAAAPAVVAKAAPAQAAAPATVQPPAASPIAAPSAAAAAAAPSAAAAAAMPAPTGLDALEAEAAASAPVAPAAAGGSWRLLAVDDDPQVTRYIQSALGKSFSLITPVDTVKDALAEIEADPEHTVVATDLIIARSDGRGILGGIEILERVREKWPDMPVLLFTDYQNEEAETKAKALGALAVLIKPRKAQVQAAAKEGGGGVVQTFLKTLGQALAPYGGTSPAAGAPARTAAAANPAAPPARPPPAPVSQAAAPAAGDTAPTPAPAPVAPAPVVASPGLASSTTAPPPALVVPHPGAAAVAVPVAAAGFDLGSEISDEMDDFGRSLEAELPPPLLSAGDMAVLRSMLAELIDPANRDTVTLLVLRFASHLCERAGLFLATRRAFVGLGGFAIEEASDLFVARVRRIQVPVDQESIFGRVTRFRSMIRGPLKETDGNKLLIKGLGGAWPTGETVAAPLISGDRVAAILFGDNPSGKPLGPTDSLEIFLQQAGLAMDRALLERKLEDSRKRGGSD
jgi:CheY-like chemotaxis protein